MMDAAALRALQAPIKERYKADPGTALITLRAKGRLDEANIACKVDTGRALAVAGLHPATGGTGLELCSGDMLLEALVACAGVTLKAVSTALGILLRSGAVNAEGDLDFRSRQGCAGRIFANKVNVRGRYRRPAGATRPTPEADRALLRRLSDDTERAAGRAPATPRLKSD